MKFTRRQLRKVIREEATRIQNSANQTKKNCGCGKDPCVTYGIQTENVLSAEESLSKWVNEPAAKYARELISKYGQPDGVTESMVIWHDGRISKFDNVYVKDEYVYHESPSPHYDYAYSTLTIHVPEDLMGAVAEASESIIIDQLKDTVTARCADIYANAITLGFVQKLALGEIPAERSKEVYEYHIKNNILPPWFVEFEEDNEIQEINRRSMKITRSKLRKIIREALTLSESAMLPIVTNTYEDVDDINILANYAHRDDMEGALKDPTLQYYINNNEAGMLVDDSKGWLHLVGDEKQMGPAPEGWNLNRVYDFIADFENEAYEVFARKESGEHDSLPNKVEREIIGNALSQTYVMPTEIEDIEFQIRRRGGKPSNINIEDDNMISNIRAEDAERKGLTLDDIVKVLRDNGAKERKKQKPIKHTPPIYD